MKEPETRTLERMNGCYEKNGVLVHYCREYDNCYCPRTCHYAHQRFKEAERRFNNE